MALSSNCGLPGSGKTEYLTYLAIKHYKRENSLLKLLIRKYIKKQEDIYVNNVYTDYPVLLDIKNNIYSNRVHINDLDNTYRFLKRSFIGIDEPQLKHDSADWQDFPRSIGMFLQLNRHFGISDIIFATQHPNRLVMYEKNIMGVYRKMHKVIRIPFTPFKFVVIRSCYEIDDYSLISTRDKETKKMRNIKISFKIYNAAKVHKHYDDKYLSPLNDCKPLLDKGTYNSLKLSEDDLKYYDEYFKNYSVKSYKEGRVNKKNGGGMRNAIGRTPASRASRNYDVSVGSFFDNL